MGISPDGNVNPQWKYCVDELPEPSEDWYICGNSDDYFVDRMFQYTNTGWWGYGDKEPEDRVKKYVKLLDILPKL